MNRALTDYETKTVANVEKHGWQGTYVFDPKSNDPSFTYSIGFTKTLNAPEFIIFGLSQDLMHSMLWRIYDQIKAGAIPKDGMIWENLLENFNCVSRKAIHQDTFEIYARSARWYWNHSGHSGFPEVYQMVWPGAQQGLFPWEEGCSQETINMQTPLWKDS
jgi:hypothetical protein